MTSCKHKKARDVGQTQWKGCTTYVYWCPECGALRREQTEGSYDKETWRMPKPAERQ